MIEDLFKRVKLRMGEEPVRHGGTKVSVPSDLMFKCPRCQTAIFREEFEKNGKVCVECGYHARISAQERIKITVDNLSFTEYDKEMRASILLTSKATRAR